MVNLSAQFASIGDDTMAAVRRTFESQQFILGPEVDALERSIARLTGARHAIGCASGSDAIMLAVAALMIETLGIGGRSRNLPTSGFAPASPLGAAPAPGATGPSGPWADSTDAPEVVTSPFTFFASAGSVVHAGARPRFADIEGETYGLDPRAVAGAMSDRTLAVMPVHLFGQPCDLAAIVEAAAGAPIIEDAAQAIGARYRSGPEGEGSSRVAGAMGILGCLSFFPTKNLGGAGDGGMTLTSDDRLAERLRKIRVHGGAQMYHHETVGWNSRLDEIQAAVLNVKLPHLEGWSEARRRRAMVYDALIAEAGLAERGLVLPPIRRPDRTHIYHQYVVRVPGEPRAGLRRRDALRDHLTQGGIGTGIYYPVPLHLQECFRPLGHARGDFPVSEKAADEVLALPIYPELTGAQQEMVVKEMAGFFRHA